MIRILLVDDDPQGLDSTRRILELARYEVIAAADGEEALEQVRAARTGKTVAFDLVISDVRMPRLGGIEFLRALSLLESKVPVVLMTAYGQVEEAVWAMKLGAVDFLTKPFKRQALLNAVESALKRRKTVVSHSQDPLIGQSPRMQELRTQITHVAPTDATVLLSGPSGSGKELVAVQIHQQSRRAKGPFIALNCAAIPEALIESELFGYERGAFSGAVDSKKGLFEAAEGGTLFLDEIGDMPISLQTSLLRVLQEREVRRVGATQTRPVDVRVISATHQDLRAAVHAGRFREDLLFRLEVVQLKVPALSERKQDLPLLLHYFVEQASIRHGKPVPSFSSDFIPALHAHDWPGNVRELINVIERAVIFSRGEGLTLLDLPEHIRKLQSAIPGLSESIMIPLGTSLKEVEEILIRKTLEATSGDKAMTAKLLGINSRTIYRKLEKQNPEEEPSTS